ncbi:MAG: DUF1320 domain-containing protein [Candidatus Binataceae bacterium]
MSYAAPADMIARFPNRDLVQLTNEDPSVTTVNTSTLQTVLDDASAEIDGYIEARFSLPLAQVPAALNLLTCEIAMYKLQALRPLHDIEDARKRYEDAIRKLEKVAKGELTLGLSPAGIQPDVAQKVETVEGPRRIFDRKRLREL